MPNSPPMPSRSGTHPRLTVIVPCYQSETTVAQTLRSVQAQRFKLWECLIVNDGSTDKGPSSPLTSPRSDPRFRVIDKPNGGLCSARNAGIRQATGQYLHFLDADDIVYPNAYRLLIARLEADRTASIAHSNYDWIDPDGNLPRTQYQPLHHRCFFAGRRCGLPARRRRCAAGRPRPDRPVRRVSVRPGRLGLLAARSRADCRCVRVARPLVGYRRAPGSMSRNAELMYADTVEVLRRTQAPDPRSGPQSGQPQATRRREVRANAGGPAILLPRPCPDKGRTELFRNLRRTLASRSGPNTADEVACSAFGCGFVEGFPPHRFVVAARLHEFLPPHVPTILERPGRARLNDFLAGLIRYALRPLCDAAAERDRLKLHQLPSRPYDHSLALLVSPGHSAAPPSSRRMLNASADLRRHPLLQRRSLPRSRCRVRVRHRPPRPRSPHR